MIERSPRKKELGQDGETLCDNTATSGSTTCHAIAESFVMHPDDLSDETLLWNVYMRWLHSFKVSRTKDEMLKRFPVFVENV
uniref:Uncharacterized protein n=1 Tax=Nymphaea colorata TaxID=210225 RepID=A0A5K1BMA1_9MAGN